MKSQNELGVPIPANKPLVVRTIKEVTKEQREYALQKTEYNMFSFPADLLFVDFLSDSGSGTMTDLQWSALFHGDESYARNKGYYVLLDAVRDTFERGNKPKRNINLILSAETDVKKLMDELYLTSYEGGFVNGGIHQLTRPNAFIVPQGRCAEHLLFSTIAHILKRNNPNKLFYIPNNGHFDTTEANITANGIIPVNLFSTTLFDEFPYDDMDKRNPFKGNMDLKRLEELIQEKGVDSIPLIYITITNNTAAGQPVSMKNIVSIYKIAQKNDIPLFFDACRFAENANFIKEFEEGYQNKSIPKIVQEMCSYVDGFTISFKKDGLANIGGGFFFKDKGLFHEKFSIEEDIGILLKEKQILTFGNDSYGGMSGRDIMALAAGLYEVVQEPYLNERKKQVREFARKLAQNGLPVILPSGGHAIYLDMDKFFEDSNMSLSDFGGVGFTIELVKNYGIRAAELGPFAFEWDKKPPELQKGVLNLVRFAVPRNVYGQSHIDYAVAAITELYKNRDKIPKVKISRGATLRLRHFQTGLQPIYG
ncbi:MAG: tryptophanase [Promethearchaeota archaeon]|jgi:tryptophanase